jgi:hypothetical protein
MTKLNKILIFNAVFVAVVLIVLVTFGLLMLPPKGNDTKDTSPQKPDTKNTSPSKPEYIPLVVKFQLTSTWKNTAWEIAKIYLGLSWFWDSNPDVYFLMRIDGIQDPLIIPVVHKDCKDRPVNQTILCDYSLKGRRAVIEIWDSVDNATMNNIRALVSGTAINAGVSGTASTGGLVQGSVSANGSINGKDIGKQLRLSDKYICQAEVILGQTQGSITLNSSGGDSTSGLFLDILPPP